jgi:hypothetical protein
MGWAAAEEACPDELTLLHSSTSDGMPRKPLAVTDSPNKLAVCDIRLLAVWDSKGYTIAT